MDKIETLENNNFYIVSLDNGIREEEPVEMNTLNTFSDGSKLVLLNNTIYGLFKENKPNMVHIDDYEIIKSDIAELLDVEHEESRRIVDEEKNVGTFTNLNYRKDIETRISATAMFNYVITLINKGNLKNEQTEKISNLLRNSHSSLNQSIKDETIIKDIINEGIDVLVLGIQTQAQQELSQNQISTLRKNYIRMILFDLLVGRKNRGLDYHLVCPIEDSKKIIFKDARFSPISILANFEKENIIPNESYFINNEYVDKKALLNTLYNSFYVEMKKVITALNDAARLYKDAITRIIYNNVDLLTAQNLETSIINNYNQIIEKQQEIEKQKNLEYKENKVERTMATQSLNIKVTTKLDFIQKKYPINPKNNGISFSAPDIDDKDKKIKLIVEEETQNAGGFINSAVLVSIVGLVCGIVTGITYILLTFRG